MLSTFHVGEWGGARNWKFESRDVEIKVSAVVCRFLDSNPLSTLDVWLSVFH